MPEDAHGCEVAVGLWSLGGKLTVKNSTCSLKKKQISSIKMQSCTWMPSPTHGCHTTQQTCCCKAPIPPVQEQYFCGQQRMSIQQNIQQSHGLWNVQSSPQPVSMLSDMQSGQMPQVWSKNSQNRLPHQNSTSTRSVLPNRQSIPLQAAQHGSLTQNLSCHPQSISTSTVPQQNCNISTLYNVNNPTTFCWFPSANSNANSATEQNNSTQQSVPTQYQSLNGYHNQMLSAPQPAAQLQQPVLPNQAPQTMYTNQGPITGRTPNGALPISVNHRPTKSLSLITPSQSSNYRFPTGRSHSSHGGNQVQHSSQIQHSCPPYRKDNSPTSFSHLKHKKKMLQNLTPSSVSTNQHFITQNQQSQNQNLSRDSVQPQTVLQPCNARQVSGHYSNAALSAIQGIIQPPSLQLNKTSSGLTLSTQNRISTSTLSSNGPPSSYITSTQNYSQLTLNSSLVGTDKTEVSDQSHGTRSLSSIRAIQEQTPNQMTTCTSQYHTPESTLYSCTPATLLGKEHQRVSRDQTTVKQSPLLTENQHALCTPLKTLDDQGTVGMQNRKMQVLSTDKKDQPGHQSQPEVVLNSEATELAILRQSAKAVAVVPPISQQGSTLEKIDPVTPNSDDGDVLALHKVTNNVEQNSKVQNLLKKTTEYLSQLVSTKHHETEEQDKPQDRATFYSLQHDAKCCDVPQSKIGPITSQDHTSETDKSCDSVSDFSNIQVFSFTLEMFRHWVRILESRAERRVKQPVANLLKFLLNLYWGGKIENLGKHIRIFTAELSSCYSEISVEEMQMAQFQYFQPKDLKLQHGYHILKNNTDIPSKEFISSWLNINGQPDDIEKVLAEPVLDLMDYSLCSNFNPLKKYSESEPSTEVIPATTVHQKNDQPTVNHEMVNEELANYQVYEDKSTEKVSNIQEALKKQEGEEYFEKPQEQDANMNPEESMDLNEIANTMIESKRKSEGEQACLYATEVNTTSETTEHKDLYNDTDFSNDSVKEYSDFDFQKESSQLCHDRTKGSAMPDKESNEFCSSAHQIKFTCPHMTNTEVDWNDEHFCTKCWEETPLLDLDLDEAPLSPNTAGLNMSTPQKQGHSDQSCNPDLDCIVLSEDSSTADSPTSNIDVFEVILLEPCPNPSDVLPSCTSSSGKLPVIDPHALMFTESVPFAISETNGSVGKEIPTTQSCAQNCENLGFPKRVKVSMDEVYPPEVQPRKRLKRMKTIGICAEDLNDISGDIVTKTVGSSKPDPSEINDASAEDDQNCFNGIKGKQKFPEMKIQIKTPFPQFAKPDPNVNACTESFSCFSCPVNMAITEANPNVGGSVPCCSQPSGKSAGKEEHGRVCSQGVSVSMSTEEDWKAHKDICVSVPKKLSRSKKIEKRKLVIPSQTKASTDKTCSPVSPLHKKLKFIKSTSLPAEDDLFTPDIMVKKAGSPKQSPSVLSVSLTEDTHHWKDEKTRRDNQQSSAVSKCRVKQHSNQSKVDAYEKKSSVKFQVSSVTPQPKRPAIGTNFDMTKDMIPGKTKQTQLNKEMKKRVKFALYGLSGHQNKFVQHQCNRKKSTAPVYITISNRPSTETLSAKQKVFSQWSKTFVETEQTSSHKKRQKPVKEELKSKTDALKRHLKDRLAMKVAL